MVRVLIECRITCTLATGGQYESIAVSCYPIEQLCLLFPEGGPAFRVTSSHILLPTRSQVLNNTNKNLHQFEVISKGLISITMSYAVPYDFTVTIGTDEWY